MNLVSCIYNYTYNTIACFLMITNNLHVFYQAFYSVQVHKLQKDIRIFVINTEK